MRWEVQVEQDSKDKELEHLRVQLAGCLAAAMGGTHDPAQPGDYGWSAAYGKVLQLRVNYEELLRRYGNQVAAGRRGI